MESEIDIKDYGDYQHSTKDKTDTMEVIITGLNNKITEEKITKCLKDKEINPLKISLTANSTDPSLNDARVLIISDALTITKLEGLRKEEITEFKQKIQLHYFIKSNDNFPKHYNIKEGTMIKYPYEYHKMIKTDFEKKSGSSGLVFKNKKIIEKQRAVMGYLLKKIGMNLLKGKSIMNVSLPINIFDVRSHIEVFVQQFSYADYYLNKAGSISDKVERLKITATFAITSVYQTVAQLKPFNPILGETFQARIGNSEYYIEQTSHHPPIFNFLVIGKEYKIYGYNESDVSSGPNSLSAKYKGNFIVQFNDGATHNVYFPSFTLSGLLMGDRVLKYKGNMTVIDEKNDLICEICMDPDDRGFLKKMFSKKSKNPDYFRGVISRLSTNSTMSKSGSRPKVKDTGKELISNLEGEFSDYIKFDDKVYWEYSDEDVNYYRLGYTLPSDSTLREDILWLKEGDEDKTQAAKVMLEEIQRADRKLRQAYQS